MESNCDRGQTRQRRQSDKKQTLKIDKRSKLNIKESMMTENTFVSKKNRSITDATFLFVSLERECFVSFFLNYYNGNDKILPIYFLYIYLSIRHVR